MKRLHARVLGAPRFHFGGTPVVPRAKKARAALAYLVARPDGVYRDELADLLWASNRRQSVYQMLHTLRHCPGGGTWLSRDRGPVIVAARSDLQLFEALVARGRAASALRLWRGEPYAGLGVPEADAFDDWLALERSRLEEMRRVALQLEADRLERRGDIEEAVGHAEALCALDPLDESAHRRLSRLHVLRGDLDAARRQLDACRRVVERELGIAMQNETRTLRDRIAAAEREIRLRPERHGQCVPAALDRPPTLVGREVELRAIEDAWAVGLVALVDGPAGMGATRLVEHAAERRGRALRIEARPGDANVPYATLGRVVADLLDALDDLKPLASTRHVLSLLAPEAGEIEPGPAAEPVTAARLQCAIASLLQRAADRLEALVLDGLHAFDPASRSIVLAALGDVSAWSGSVALTLRSAELDAVSRNTLTELVACGQAALVPLRPLGDAAVAAVLTEVEAGGGMALARSLARYTRGTPLYLLEVLRSLHAEGRLASTHTLPRDLAVPPRIRAIVERKLAALDPDALRIARVLALEPAAGPDLVAEVAQVDEATVDVVIGSLVAVDLLCDRGGDDVVVQAIKTGTPGRVARRLHRRIASRLAARGAAPAVVAAHRRAAGDAG